MVQIPTARDVGRVSTRSGRIATSGPSVSVGEGVAQFGQGLQQVAYDLNDLRTRETADNQNKAGFDLQTKIARFRDAEEQAYLAAKEASSESGIGFTRKFMEGYQERANAFGEANFAGLNDAQKESAKQSILGLGNSLYGKAHGYEQVAKTAFYDRTTNTGLDTVRVQIKNNAAPFEELKRQGLAAIDAADMPEPWKAARRAEWDSDAAESKWQWKFAQDPQAALSDLKPSGTKNLIRKEEGFRAEPYRDVNAWRIGYGSDTVTLPDGSQVAVKPGMKITREDAERDLQYRLSQREGAKAREQIGGQWGSLSLNVQSALESVAYNYGSLPNSVVKAVKSGDNEAVAKAIEALPANPDRRKREAAIVRGTGQVQIEDEYAAISYDRREQLANWGESEYNRQVNEQRAISRGQIDLAITNAPVAIQNSGSYSGALPTSDDFIRAYGPQEGAQRYNAFASSIETSQQAYAMQTMPVSDIDAMLSNARPVSTGDDAALQAARYETLVKAAEQTVKAREVDPARYAQQAFPHVAQAWQQAAAEGDFRTALSVTAAAQQQLGVRNMRLMPKAVADEAITKFNDQNVPGVDRISAVTGLVFATSDPAQRRAIFEQLVAAGLPDTTEGAIEAYARGDEGAGRRLMEAAIVDPSNLPGASPVKPAEIDAEIQAQIMDEGQIGDIAYGLSDGTIENQERAIRDSKLLTNAVSIRVRNGETLEAAVQGAAKDLYGDVQAVAGNGDVNAQILLPADADPAPVLDGLAGLLPTVRQRLESTVVPPQEVGTADGGKAILGAVRENYIDNVMAEGYFRNAGDGYVFMDPYVGAAIAGPDGQPLIFKDADLVAAPRVERPAPDFQDMPQTRIPTREQVNESEYGKFAPLLDATDEPEAATTFDPGPLSGGGGS